MAQRQDFRLKRSPRSEKLDDRSPNQLENIAQ
jgi:hypothetical protein